MCVCVVARQVWVRVSPPVLAALDQSKYVVLSQLPGVLVMDRDNVHSAPQGTAPDDAVLVLVQNTVLRWKVGWPVAGLRTCMGGQGFRVHE